MDGTLMRSTLQTELIASARLHYDVDHAEPWYLLHDNDKKFRSNIVSEWIHNNGVQMLDFPPYSPDLNPMENLWHVVQQRVDKHDCSTLTQLEHAIREEWTNLAPELCGTLARSMPHRIAAVINAEGWHTKY